MIDSKASIEQDKNSKSVKSGMSLKSGMLGNENNQSSASDTGKKTGGGGIRTHV
ncbi:MAG: hypothetical protein WC476_08285 [Phycisphaerae bacterium]